ncbi:MAG: class II fructose-bisphosphate aldolase [Angelakisella sp.]
MLVNSQKVLLDAKNGGYGLPAPDYLDLDSARVFAKVAERFNMPLLLSYPQVISNSLPLEEAAAVGKIIAERASVPVVLHLDHGEDFTFIKRAIDLGFTSVMIDASMDSFEENIRKTREVVEYAHPRGVTVEAEIGHVGHGINLAEIGFTDSVYTTVEEAVRFVELTNVDSLAVSIGTVHGFYKNATTPQLNFERLKELRDAVQVPLVLHGGSGSGEENLRRCVVEGISKVNIFTDLLTGAIEKINEDKPSNYPALKQSADAGMDKILSYYYGLFTRPEER